MEEAKQSEIAREMSPEEMCFSSVIVPSTSASQMEPPPRSPLSFASKLCGGAARIKSHTLCGSAEQMEPFLASPSESFAQTEPRRGSSLPCRSEVKIEVTSGRRITTIEDHGDGVLLPDCCRVPITVRHLKKEPYTPKVVSIGPFHYGNERLQDIEGKERHKQILFERFIQNAMLSREDLVGWFSHLESKVRASYSEIINLDPEQLAKLILLDAGFIIELFIMSYKPKLKLKKGGNNYAKLKQPWLKDSIRLDLLLLENQLPFFFIEELYNEVFSHQDFRGSLPSFLELTYEYFKHFNQQKLDPACHCFKIKHFTDLLRLFHLQGSMPERIEIPRDGSHILSYNANALQEAGIKLRKRDDHDDHKSKSFLDLKFSGHTLEIPQILVDDNTELLFRNMIALEQCHYPDASYITDYALLLDWLIDTKKDVDLLIHKKIVKNYLGDTNNVASLFNGLSDNVVQSTFNSDLVKISRSLTAYCEDHCNEMKATLRHDYCRTPWQTVASIAAIVLLVLTVVQTVISILQVVN